MGEIGDWGEMVSVFEPLVTFELDGGTFGVLDRRAGDAAEVAKLVGRCFGVSDPFVTPFAPFSRRKIGF